MYNDDKTPLDKAISAISILSNPDIDKIKKVAGIYEMPFKTIMALISPITISGRTIYLLKSKVDTIKQTQKIRAQWLKQKSQELKSHAPHISTNKKHSRQAFSGTAKPVEDPTRLVMQQKVISEITDSKKEYINTKWKQLTSH